MTDETPGWTVLHSGDGVIEGPTWDGRGGLFYSNVTAGGVHRLDLATGQSACVVEHRRGIGGLALSEAGDLVVSGRNIAVKPRDGATDVVFSAEGLDHEVIGFNDIAVMPSRAVAVGALGPGSLNPHKLVERPAPPPDGEGTGRIYAVWRGGHATLADDIGHPNGIAFSADGGTAYVSDTLRRCVFRFTVTPQGWTERAVFARFEDGMPDGMTVAADGTLWLALALASRIVALSPAGAVVRSLRTPHALTTSVRFGGPALRDLFVTTGSHGAPGGGAVLTTPAPVAGLPAWRAAL